MQVPACPPAPHTHSLRPPALRGRDAVGCSRTLRSRPFVTRVTGPGARGCLRGAVPPRAPSPPPALPRAGAARGRAAQPQSAQQEESRRTSRGGELSSNSAREGRETPCGHFSATSPSLCPRGRDDGLRALGGWAALAAPLTPRPPGESTQAPTRRRGTGRNGGVPVFDCAGPSRGRRAIRDGVMARIRRPAQPHGDLRQLRACCCFNEKPGARGRLGWRGRRRGAWGEPLLQALRPSVHTGCRLPPHQPLMLGLGAPEDTERSPPPGNLGSGRRGRASGGHHQWEGGGGSNDEAPGVVVTPLGQRDAHSSGLG